MAFPPGRDFTRVLVWFDDDVTEDHQAYGAPLAGKKKIWIRLISLETRWYLRRLKINLIRPKFWLVLYVHDGGHLVKRKGKTLNGSLRCFLKLGGFACHPCRQKTRFVPRTHTNILRDRLSGKVGGGNRNYIRFPPVSVSPNGLSDAIMALG